MVVGVAKVQLFIPENRSLKGKRQVVKSLLRQINGRFKNVSVAEVDDQDLWQRAQIGLTTVGSDQRFINSLLDRALDYIEAYGGVEVIETKIEIISL
ncbi:DUF503 domain-containing protein [Thermosulfuriphilus ammonigenes]|uniref:DUF503 domain-containing protein n=2 Tax=Thermosulfuriphilus ammonigenes TaxID=1936021 RepID=A0A6G7PZ73_9BACT|nr:DUF503 domain-containing protein [Thermosulfuriphilus ammonigenes]